MYFFFVIPYGYYLWFTLALLEICIQMRLVNYYFDNRKRHLNFIDIGLDANAYLCIDYGVDTEWQEEFGR